MSASEEYNLKNPVVSFRVDHTIKEKLLELADEKPLQIYMRQLIIEYLKIKGIMQVTYKFND